MTFSFIFPKKNSFYVFVVVHEKLHWAFKLYDKDGNGEIDPEEMQEIFTKLCSLVTAEKRMEEKAREREEAAKKKLLLSTKLKLQKEDTGNFKLMSSKLIARTKRVEKKKRTTTTNEPKNLQKSKSSNFLSLPVRDDDLSSNHGSDCSSSSELLAPASSRSGRMSLDSGVSLECPGLSLAWELRDPDRDCAVFDPVERARDLFEALDVDGDGAVTEEEFITGCLKDEAFILLLERFNGDDIWGT